MYAGDCQLDELNVNKQQLYPRTSHQHSAAENLSRFFVLLYSTKLKIVTLLKDPEVYQPIINIEGKQVTHENEMKPNVVADEMFPEGPGPFMDLEEAGGSTGLLMDLAANEKDVHADFFNDFEDLFDEDEEAQM